MSNLIPDIITSIIKELDDDYDTLFNCLLVNKLWCKLTIPILWRDCNLKLRSYEKNISFVKILFTFLSEEQKTLLIENEINLSFIPTQKPLFNYISFCRSIVTFNVSNAIKDGFDPPLSIDQGRIIEEEFYEMIFNNSTKLNRLNIHHGLCCKKHDTFNFLRSKDSLSNLVELTCGQYVDENFFYILADICFNIKKLVLKGGNKNNNRGLIKLIEVQNKLETFIYNGNKCKRLNWDKFCEEIGQALIKHKNTLKLIYAKTRLCIPHNILNSFINLETLMLGYSPSTMKDIHLVKLPKLQCLRVCYLTNVKELIQNTSGYLKKVEIYHQHDKNVKVEDIIQIIIVVYQYCPKLEYLYIPFIDTIDDALEDLLINCNQLKNITVYYRFPNESLNGDGVLNILLKSTSRKLQRIEMKGSWKFSIEALEEFLNNLKERNYSLYFKFDLDYSCFNDEFSNVFQNFIHDNVLKNDPLI